MKKLMIAAAIVCAAVCANAATAEWGMGLDAYIMAADGSSYYNGAVHIACEALSYETTATAVDGYFTTVLDNIDSTYPTDYTWTLTAETATHTYLATATSYWVSDVPAKARVYFGSGTWTAVPEPTSGLLMLLGMAGLALKRRRA